MQAPNAYCACMNPTQLTVRAVPTGVTRKLRQKATQEGKSINAVVLETLESGLGLTGPPPLQHDLDSFFGRWEKDVKFDKAIQHFAAIDAEVWR